MLTDERRAKIQEMRDDSRWLLAPAVRGALRDALAEIDRLKSAERLFGDALSLLTTAFASDGPCKGLILLGDSLTEDGIPAMVREIVRLRGEVVGLKESTASRSELAATTIAGLEVQVERLRAENKVLEAERDAILNLCVHTSYAFEREYVAFTGDFRGIPMDRLMCAANRTEAVSWVRKAAGLDPIFGSPVPPADGGPDA
jgi:hypothetical protein